MDDAASKAPPATPPVFIISGGSGGLAKHLARVTLAQFPKSCPEIIVIASVRDAAQLRDAMDKVTSRGGMILHTMVEPELHAQLVALAAERGIAAVDTVGDALAQMASVFGEQPIGEPGLYHGEDQAYLERIKAIEFTVDHDDGMRPDELDQADVVLTGVSRVGKTPLSIFLSVLGWKVANIPLVMGIEPPKQLFTVDRRRVVGLTIDAKALSSHRSWRQRTLGGSGGGEAYVKYAAVFQEIEWAQRLFRKAGFAIIDVTNKPVEESADQVIARVTSQLDQMVTLPTPSSR